MHQQTTRSGLAGDPDVSHWLEAAEKRRFEARRAFARAATAASPDLARRFEVEATAHLASARCHEFAAQSAFNSSLVTENPAHAPLLQNEWPRPNRRH